MRVKVKSKAKAVAKHVAVPAQKGSRHNAAKAVGDSRTRLPLAQLVESKTNPRRSFPKQSLLELAWSIQQNPLGIVEPLVVRKLGAKEYEIVAGARRFRAAKLAGLKDVPVSIVELTDAGVLETQLIENLQREDPHPLEEAEGYAALLKMPGYTADKIAERVGKDRSYIYRRMSLVNLVAPAKAAFLEGRINIQHAQRIVRLVGETSQLQAFSLCFKEDFQTGEPLFNSPAVTALELDESIAREITLKLSSAPWKLKDPDVLPAAGACMDCSKRSGSNPTLFGEAEIKAGDMCLDRSCFQAKRKSFVQIDIARSEAAGRALVPVATFGAGDEELGSEVIRTNAYHRLYQKPCPRAEKAIVVAGRELGEHFNICRDRECPEHGKSNRSLHAGNGTRANAQNDKAAAKVRLDQQIDIAVRQDLIRLIAIGDRKFGDIEVTGDARPLLDFFIDLTIERVGYDARREMLKALGVEMQNVDRVEFEIELKKIATQAIEAGSVLAFLTAMSVANPYGAGDRDQAAALLGIDVKAVRNRVAAPLQEKFEKRFAKKSAAE